jgi:hypothetical protein
MFRIGGDFRGIIASAELLAGMNRPYAVLPHGLAYRVVDRSLMEDVDELTRTPSGLIMEGFTFLSAGVIAYLELHSAHGVVGYAERHWGLEIVDCAAAWHRGKLVAGPIGTAVHADATASAFSEVLTALGLDPFHHAEVFRAIADAKTL